MVVGGVVRRGAYFDSITLMNVGRRLIAEEGVDDGAAVMGTAENKRLLTASGLLVDELAAAGENDLLIALRAENEGVLRRVLENVDGLLRDTVPRKETGEYRAAGVEGALRLLPGANLALISVAGRYAGALAMTALRSNLHVMIFSDNVSIDTEISLKRYGAEHGLLVMGPDCGSAIIGGVPLGFANAVRRGKIGVVAASGTGLQEVTSLVSNAGEGISQAIGTGGRDLSDDVGGITFLEGMRALGRDAETEVLVLLSKPPGPNVARRVKEAAADIGKPVVSLLLGAAPSPGSPSALAEAAASAVALARGEDPAAAIDRVRSSTGEEEKAAEDGARRIAKGRKYVRGLYSGGTFAGEAQLILAESVSPLFSNTPAGGARALDDPLGSEAHTVIDMGADEFTVGRPHPMIDFELRNRRIIEEGRDPSVAVILFDVVLGFGAHPDPAGALHEALLSAGRDAALVCSVTGTDRDPQNRSAVEEALRADGVCVLPSNAAAARLAGRIARLVKGSS